MSDPFAALTHLFAFGFMRHAFAAGTLVAVTAGVVGYFVALRGLSFASHALSHVGFAGAAGAVVLHVDAVYGLIAFAGAGAVGMGMLGTALRGRDVAIGIVLAWSLGLGVLFLSLYSGYATAAYALLFGQVLGISERDVEATAAASLAALAAIAVTYRPLLFASVDEDAAEARGVPVRTIGVVFLLILALTVAIAAQVVGVLLIFALLVTPAAIAERLTAHPARAIALSVALALAFTWGGLIAAYVLPYPVSFFITTFAFAAYVAVRVAESPRVRRQG